MQVKTYSPAAKVRQASAYTSQANYSLTKGSYGMDTFHALSQRDISYQPRFSGFPFNPFAKIKSFFNDREIRKLNPVVKEVNSWDEKVSKLTPEELKAKKGEFQNRLHARLKQLKKIPAEDTRELSKLIDPIKDRKIIQKALDEILPEAFAVVKEAAHRTLGMKPYDVQVMGGIALHNGSVIEMKTGEGKTLTATMPAYLNALLGLGVHIHTANDYLAKRDADEMGPLYNALGLSVGVIYPEPVESMQSMDTHMAYMAKKKEAYLADITYGTSSEFGFDYLKDHIDITDPNLKVQRPYYFAIADEADKLMIDEARVPLVISERVTPDQAEQKILIAQYLATMNVANRLVKGKDYTIDEKEQTILLSEEGILKAEALLCRPLSQADEGNLHALLQSIKVKELFQENDEYIVKNGEITIVDEFTGRFSEGRRWSQGLHSAVEAKELLAGKKVAMKGEDRTQASVSFQSFFTLYPKLSGMTGTAATDAAEFYKVYGLPIVVLPTNKPYIQTRMEDVFCEDRFQKFETVLKEIESIQKYGQHVTLDQKSEEPAENGEKKTIKHKRPILVGTRSIEDSELLSEMLKARGIPHNVLNAKKHAQEAQIIAEAGALGAVTIATNMAGRGVDIKLGGTPEGRARAILEEQNITPENTEPAVYQAEFNKLMSEPDKLKKLIADDKKIITEQLGGLYVIGTDRSFARRVDNQLAGRCARQGEPGTVRFFLSLEDNLFTTLADQDTRAWLARGTPKESGYLAKVTKNFQKKMEELYYSSRFDTFKYDGVVDNYRREVYEDRDRVLFMSEKEEVESYIHNMVSELIRKASTQLQPLLGDLGEIDKIDEEVFVKLVADKGNRSDIPAELLYRICKETDLITEMLETEGKSKKEITEELITKYNKRSMLLWDTVGKEAALPFYRYAFLERMDDAWKIFLEESENLRRQILPTMDPVVLYTLDTHRVFDNLKLEMGLGVMAHLLPYAEVIETYPQVKPLVEFIHHSTIWAEKKHELREFLLNMKKHTFALLENTPRLFDPDSKRDVGYQTYLNSYKVQVEKLATIPELASLSARMLTFLQSIMSTSFVFLPNVLEPVAYKESTNDTPPTGAK